MANIRYRNASEMSRVLARGVDIYAKRQDLPVGSVGYREADLRWAAFCEQEPGCVPAVKAVQATIFDIALDIVNGVTGQALTSRPLSKGLA